MRTSVVLIAMLGGALSLSASEVTLEIDDSSTAQVASLADEISDPQAYLTAPQTSGTNPPGNTNPRHRGFMPLREPAMMGLMGLGLLGLGAVRRVKRFS